MGVDSTSATNAETPVKNSSQKLRDKKEIKSAMTQIFLHSKTRNVH